MKCPYCYSINSVIWSSKRGIYKCKQCNKYFTEKTNPHRGIIINNTRYCSVCGELKSLNNFYKKNGKPRSVCKECMRVGEKVSRFAMKNITRSDFISMIKLQNNKCKICNNDLKSLKNSFIDHNHNTNKVRGILCPSCNTFLGLCNDDIGILKNAIIYLQTCGI